MLSQNGSPDWWFEGARMSIPVKSVRVGVGCSCTDGLSSVPFPGTETLTCIALISSGFQFTEGKPPIGCQPLVQSFQTDTEKLSRPGKGLRMAQWSAVTRCHSLRGQKLPCLGPIQSSLTTDGRSQDLLTSQSTNRSASRDLICFTELQVLNSSGWWWQRCTLSSSY